MIWILLYCPLSQHIQIYNNSHLEPFLLSNNLYWFSHIYYSEISQVCQWGIFCIINIFCLQCQDSVHDDSFQYVSNVSLMSSISVACPQFKYFVFSFMSSMSVLCLYCKLHVCNISCASSMSILCLNYKF